MYLDRFNDVPATSINIIPAGRANVNGNMVGPDESYAETIKITPFSSTDAVGDAQNHWLNNRGDIIADVFMAPYEARRIFSIGLPALMHQAKLKFTTASG